jgi:hypothetical protein
MATISIFNAGRSSISIHTEAPVVDQDGDPDLRSSTPDIASIDEHHYTIEQANKQANEAALAVIAAEVDKPRLIEELHAVHARWGTLHAQLYWMLNHDLTGDFDPNSAYPNHLDRMRRDGPSVEALRATWHLDNARQSKQLALWDQCVQALSSDAETPLPAG